MPKKYYFTYDFNKHELLNKFMKYKVKKFKSIIFNELYVRIDEPNLIIQQKTGMQHPLQRYFIGKIISHDNNKTEIVGTFKYPFVNSCLFFLFGLVCLVGNLIMLSSANIIPIDKIHISLAFVVAYLFVITMFLSGRFLYTKQENRVLEFLKEIS